ncbi:MAG: Crp/Fnr family transcriptional regulator [Candidatus Bipolaricaulota bacterium]|nr:Crp/Fnr family transcriptional regulator [Candidatus Bipolaricaulota bacterium]
MERLSCAQCHLPCPLAGLPLHEARALEELIRSVSFLPKHVLFEQGDPHNGCYLLCEGVVMLFHRTSEGRRIVVGVVGPGDMVGVGSLLGQECHELSACALTEVRAQHLSRAVCKRLVQEPSVLTARLLLVLARQVKILRRHARFVAAHAGVQERLAALLLALGERFGRRVSPQGVCVELKLSYDLLGQMIDARRTTVNQVLSEWRERRWIARESRKVLILQEEALRELAKSLI